MPPRQRSLPTYSHAGYKGRYGSVEDQGIFLTEYHQVNDYVEPGDCAAFTVQHYTCEGGRATQFDRSNYWQGWFENTAVTGIRDPGYFPHLTGLYGDIGDGAYATITAARTNPSSPYVDIPVNILELGDVALLLKKAGSSLLQQLASNYIKYQFGIKPIVGDLVKLINFAEQVDRRVKQIEKLRAKGLRRTITLASLSKSEIQNRVLNTEDAYWTADFQVQTSCVVKGHARWVPTVDLSHMTQPEMTALAKKAVLGLTIDFATLWEAMPWSWLIDWGTQMGNFLKAQRNIIPAQLETVTISRALTTTYTWPGADWGYGRITPINIRRWGGYRNPWVVTPTAHLPFLSGDQVGILASLAIMRAK
jgi:hypothetical protein